MVCHGDFNNDGKVDINDLNKVLANWGKTTVASTNMDTNKDGRVGLHELIQVIFNWGDCPISEGN